jgi:hypothetical protein
MSTPRKVSVSVSVSVAGAPFIDVTSDLISFTYEEAAAGVGETLEIELDDSSKRYRSIWFVEKGTAIQGTITTTDWKLENSDVSIHFRFGNFQTRLQGGFDFVLPQTPVIQFVIEIKLHSVCLRQWLCDRCFEQ